MSKQLFKMQTEVKAVRFNGKNIDELRRFLGKYVDVYENTSGYLEIYFKTTLHRESYSLIGGEWIVKLWGRSTDAQFKILTARQFNKMFKKA